MTLNELLAAGTIPQHIQLGEQELGKLIRRYKGLLKQTERDQAFWAATNENLKKAYEKLDEKDRELAKAYGIIQEDLSVASQIQEALLPGLISSAPVAEATPSGYSTYPGTACRRPWS
jgi:hypothetical protein